jgi:hypothetical protein
MSNIEHTVPGRSGEEKTGMNPGDSRKLLPALSQPLDSVPCGESRRASRCVYNQTKPDVRCGGMKL